MIKSIISATALALLVLMAGCATPVVYTSAPPPPPAYVPDYYVWDGYEYVGVYGDQYVYWHRNAWVICDPVILGRFHGWQYYHPGWRGHAYRYYGGRPHYR